MAVSPCFTVHAGPVFAGAARPSSGWLSIILHKKLANKSKLFLFKEYGFQAPIVGRRKAAQDRSMREFKECTKKHLRSLDKSKQVHLTQIKYWPRRRLREPSGQWVSQKSAHDQSPLGSLVQGGMVLEYIASQPKLGKAFLLVQAGVEAGVRDLSPPF